MLTFDDINDKTGFANGEKFESEQEVREYFTVESMASMFSGNLADYPGLTDQNLLDQMAGAVIENGWHMTHIINEEE